MNSDNTTTSLIVVFGRPGAGKTSISTAAIEKLNNKKNSNDNSSAQNLIHGLDLDVCVPQWMRDNFSRGIYPTLEQRNVFAVDCCEYVKNEIGKLFLKRQEDTKNNKQIIITVIISFSFVNTDLRDIFRSHFPYAIWVLVDTTEEEAAIRIKTRKDHFYKETKTTTKTTEKTIEEENRLDSKTKKNADNSDWDFAPVTFPHVVLDGNLTIDKNAEKLVQISLEQ